MMTGEDLWKKLGLKNIWHLNFSDPRFQMAEWTAHIINSDHFAHQMQGAEHKVTGSEGPQRPMTKYRTVKTKDQNIELSAQGFDWVFGSWSTENKVHW